MANVVTKLPGIGVFLAKPAHIEAWARESEGQGSYAEGFEVFHHPRHHVLKVGEMELCPGWYWQETGQEPLGPFASARRAALDAKQGMQDLKKVHDVLTLSSVDSQISSFFSKGSK